MTESLEQFTYQGETLTTQYVETMQVVEGVTCDIYIHPETDERDLGIITIQPGYKTPSQKVLKGDETIEGHISGTGKLTITHKNGEKTILNVSDSDDVEFSQVVQVGELMQWEATGESELVVFEICYPPYEDGRFENIEE